MSPSALPGVASSLIVAPVIPQPSLTFPSSPLDGDLALIVDSLTAPTFQWLFRYESGISDADKWVFIGGSPASLHVAATVSTASSSYVDLSGGPSITLPAAGTYDYQLGAMTLGTAGGASMSLVMGAAGAGVTRCYYEPTVWGSVATGYRQAIAAGNLLAKVQYASGSGTCQWQNRWLKMLPVRVAG